MFLIIENVTAEVCIKCGEKTYSPEVTDELLLLAREKAAPARKIKVPAYEFAANR